MSDTKTEKDRPFRKVGVLWKPKPSGKSLGSGSITIGMLRQRFVILRNERKAKDADPDYVLMSGDEPETDTYARDRHAPTSRGAARPRVAEPETDWSF